MDKGVTSLAMDLQSTEEVLRSYSSIIQHIHTNYSRRMYFTISEVAEDYEKLLWQLLVILLRIRNISECLDNLPLIALALRVSETDLDIYENSLYSLTECPIVKSEKLESKYFGACELVIDRCETLLDDRCTGTGDVTVGEQEFMLKLGQFGPRFCIDKLRIRVDSERIGDTFSGVHDVYAECEGYLRRLALTALYITNYPVTLPISTMQLATCLKSVDERTYGKLKTLIGSTDLKNREELLTKYKECFYSLQAICNKILLQQELR